jgi:glycosyltransferase involved in cell wall biosynthesis
MSDQRRLIFDLTTSSRWYGPPSGIVRTERQLGLMAGEMTSIPVSYSIYDKRTQSYYSLKPQVYARVMAGTLIIEPPVEPVEASTLLPQPVEIDPPPDPIRFRLQPRKYILARLGFDVRKKSKPRSTDPPGQPELPSRAPAAPPQAERSSTTVLSPSDKKIAFENAIEARLDLSFADTLVSCGADWHGKDLYAIYCEKKRVGFRYVAVCYDVIPWRSPHYWPPGIAESVVSCYGELAWLADLVICISRMTMREYSELCAAMDIPQPKLAVFRLGEADLAQSPGSRSRKARLPKQIREARYVLMVAAIEPRKNHWMLYHVWEDLLVHKSIDSDIKLVLVGVGNWLTDDLMRQIRAHPLLGDSIVILHSVSEEQLDLLYKSCLFTVYPSFHEGWGLPVAESLKYGKVCISSNRGSLPEISPLAILLDPLDVYAWRDAIRDYILDEELRNNRERLIRDEFAPTSWEQSARQFFAAVMTP